MAQSERCSRRLSRAEDVLLMAVRADDGQPPSLTNMRSSGAVDVALTCSL